MIPKALSPSPATLQASDHPSAQDPFMSRWLPEQLAAASWQIMAASEDVFAVADTLDTLHAVNAGTQDSTQLAIAVGRLLGTARAQAIPHGSPLGSCLTGGPVRTGWARTMLVAPDTVAGQWQFYEQMYGPLLTDPVPDPGPAAIDRLLHLQDLASSDLGIDPGA